MANGQKKDTDKKLSVLFVCTGNTCRSPIAEAILRELVRVNELEHRIYVGSAGLMAYDGLPASAMAVEVCACHGLDLLAHSSRQLTVTVMTSSDLVVCMQRGHMQALEQFEQVRGKELLLLGTFSSPAMENCAEDISDPFGGSRSEYESTFDTISGCMAGLLEYLKKRLEQANPKRRADNR